MVLPQIDCHKDKQSLATMQIFFTILYEQRTCPLSIIRKSRVQGYKFFILFYNFRFEKNKSTESYGWGGYKSSPIIHKPMFYIFNDLFPAHFYSLTVQFTASLTPSFTPSLTASKQKGCHKVGRSGSKCGLIKFYSNL